MSIDKEKKKKKKKITIRWFISCSCLLLSLFLIQLQEQYPSCLDPSLLLFVFFFSSFLFVGGLNDWLCCYCNVGLVAHFLFSFVWWWHAHVYNTGLQYSLENWTTSMRMYFIRLLFASVNFRSFYFFFFCFLQWGVATWRAKFAFILIIIIITITCSFQIYTINVIYLARISFSFSSSCCCCCRRTNKYISMIIADYYNN